MPSWIIYVLCQTLLNQILNHSYFTGDTVKNRG